MGGLAGAGLPPQQAPIWIIPAADPIGTTQPQLLDIHPHRLDTEVKLDSFKARAIGAKLVHKPPRMLQSDRKFGEPAGALHSNSFAEIMHAPAPSLPPFTFTALR